MGNCPVCKLLVYQRVVLPKGNEDCELSFNIFSPPNTWDKVRIRGIPTSFKFKLFIGSPAISIVFPNVLEGVLNPQQREVFQEPSRKADYPTIHLSFWQADRMLDMGFEPQIRRIIEVWDTERSVILENQLLMGTLVDCWYNFEQRWTNMDWGDINHL